MEELVQLLYEEAEREERATWYSSGEDAEAPALRALMKVLERVQRRLEEEN